MLIMKWMAGANVRQACFFVMMLYVKDTGGNFWIRDLPKVGIFSILIIPGMEVEAEHVAYISLE